MRMMYVRALGECQAGHLPEPYSASQSRLVTVW